MAPTVGVLALQGDVREHARMLEHCGVSAVPVRRERELAAVDGIVIPGGESTTIDKLLRAFDLFDPLQRAIRAGLPAYGSCAWMILLADRVLDWIEGQQTLGGLDVTVRRNAFGRQVDSFEADLLIEGVAGAPLHAVFIRAPWVESVGPRAEVLGTVSAGPAACSIVAVLDRNVIATSFHPEITDDDRVHRVFVEIVRENS